MKEKIAQKFTGILLRDLHLFALRGMSLEDHEPHPTAFMAGESLKNCRDALRAAG